MEDGRRGPGTWGRGGAASRGGRKVALVYPPQEPVLPGRCSRVEAGHPAGGPALGTYWPCSHSQELLIGCYQTLESHASIHSQALTQGPRI